jgi:diguanylate cyclase (GGDEF)-like protein
MWNAIKLRGFWQGEVWDRCKDGSIYPKLLMIFSVKRAGGKIVNYVGSFTDITEQKKAEEQIRHLAYHDTLTGLANRFTVLDRLERAISHGRRNNSAVAVMFIDLDNFKEINDTLGHDVGDDLLVQVAGRLQEQVRESDTVARLGGDEFVVVLPDINNQVRATRVAENILSAIGSPFTSGLHTLRTTPSIGIAIFPADGKDVQTVIKNADAAMYRAKSLGRNNYQYFSEISDQS